MEGLIFSLGIVFVLFSIAAFIARGRVYAGLLANSVAISILLIFLRVYGVPPANMYLQKTLYKYATYSRQALGEDGILATYGINQPSIVFYAKQKIIKLEEGDMKKLNSLAVNNTLLLITKKNNIDLLSRKSHLITLDSDQEYALLTNNKSLVLPH